MSKKETKKDGPLIPLSVDPKLYSQPQFVRKKINGITHHLVYRSDQERLLIVKPFYEQDEITRLVSSLRPGDTFLDVGAATGTFTIPSALKVGERGRVYAVEPEQEIVDGLKENLRFNKISNTTVILAALWDTDGFVRLHTEGRAGFPPIATDRREMGTFFHHHQKQVRTRTIASLVVHGEIPPPDIIKIDVEGGGGKVLDGMVKVRPREIFFEYHPPSKHPHSTEDKPTIISSLLRRGYRLTSTKTRTHEEHLHFQLQG
jgi:FkbM family methyltransferase